METFKIDVARQDLADLQQRISRTTLPDQQEGVAWEQGTSSAYLQVCKGSCAHMSRGAAPALYW